jgi:hypothetical protein
MNGEAVQKIREIVEQNTRTTDIHGGAFLRVVTSDGKVRHDPVPPLPRGYHASSLDGFIEGVIKIGGTESRLLIAEGEGESERAQPDFPEATVFVGPQRVRLLLDEEDRREAITLDLKQTEAFTALRFDKLKGLSQADMTHQLKRLFNNNVLPASLVPAIRKVKWKANSEGRSEIKVGNESIGRDVLREVHGFDGEWPEDVQLAVRVFTDPSLSETEEINCVFSIDLVAESFSLVPIEGECERALDDALRRISDEIASTEGMPAHIRIVHGVTA